MAWNGSGAASELGQGQRPCLMVHGELIVQKNAGHHHALCRKAVWQSISKIAIGWEEAAKEQGLTAWKKARSWLG